MTKISSKSIVAASANQKIPVSPDNAISPHTIKIYADAAVDLTTVEAVALGASADDGTLYRITGTGGSPLPTGIDNILIWGASSMAGGFDYGNARASVTALGVYVPCTYDVATNKIGGKVILWAGDLTQTGSNDPSVDRTHINLFATNPTFAYAGSGNYLFVAPIDFFSIENFIPTSLILDISGVLVYTNFSAIRKLNIWSGIINDGFYDYILNNTYIEIRINLSDLI